MSNEIDYPTFVRTNLPDVTYDRDAGGVWRYWMMLKNGAVVGQGDMINRVKAYGWEPAEEHFYGHIIGPASPPYRRPIPRPTERLKGACYLSHLGYFIHPFDGRTTKDESELDRWLTACENSCQAEPGDGKPVPQEKGEESVEHYLLEHWGVDVRANGKHVLTIESNCMAGKNPLTHAEERAIREAGYNLLCFTGEPPVTMSVDDITWLYWVSHTLNDEANRRRMKGLVAAIASLQQQVAGLREERDGTDLVPIRQRKEQPTPTSCFRACVATALGLEVDEVPRCCDGDAWDWNAFQDWLAGFGMQAIELLLGDLPILYPIPRKAPVIITGPSSRECPSGRHAVVGRCLGLMGFEYLHDPHPDGTFLGGDPTHLIFFVLLNPKKARALTARATAAEAERDRLREVIDIAISEKRTTSGSVEAGINHIVRMLERMVGPAESGVRR